MKKSKFFSQTKLKNGLQIISENIPTVRSVSLGFWINIGTRDEPEEKTGITHFAEHLLFKGTPKRTAKDIAETFDSIGGELNAFSAKEYTCFFAKVLDQHLSLAIEVLSDILQNPLFKPADIAAERRVVLEEINMHEDNPADLVHDYFDSELWQNHPLGRRVLGHTKTIKAIRREDILKHFNQSYLPSNMVVAAAGNVSHNKLVNLIHGELVREGEKKISRPEVKPEINSRVSVYPRKTQQAHICYGTEGLPVNHDDRFALAVLDAILGGGMSSRLFQNIREKRGLVYSIFSYHAQFTETGVMAVYAGTHPNKAPEVVRLIKEEIKGLNQDGITKAELERAREHLKGNLVLSLEDTTTRMSRLGKAILSKTEILSVDDLIKRVDAVDMKDIRRLSNMLFKPDKMVLAVIGPFQQDAFVKEVET